MGLPTIVPPITPADAAIADLLADVADFFCGARVAPPAWPFRPTIYV